MKKTSKLKTFFTLICIGVLTTAFSIEAKPGDIAARVRLYEGFRSTPIAPADVVSSYYLKPLSEKNVQAELEVSKEIETLKRVFNMEDVKLITDAVLVLKKKQEKSPFQVVVLNGRKFIVQLSVIEENNNRFKVEVLEDGSQSHSLFSGSIILPQKKSTALGFEDSEGKIYFLSFHRNNDLPSPPSVPSTPKTPPAEPALLASVDKISKPVTPDRPPRLIHRVVPVYPEEALKSKVSGVVTLQATTDAKGNVIRTKVLKGPEMLREAAITAVKQWKYEPYIIDGVEKGVRFDVMLNFRLNREDSEEPINVSALKSPKLIKRVEVPYPKEAVKKGVSGKVVLEAVTDREGNVVKLEVIDGHPDLNDAAIDTIKQWKYEPYIIDGKKKGVRFTVVVRFILDEKKEKNNTRK